MRRCSACRAALLTPEASASQVGAHFASAAAADGAQRVRVARVDVHAHRELVEAHNLTGVPTFVLYPRGVHKARCCLLAHAWPHCIS